MVTENNLEDLHKDAKNMMPKEPTRYYLFIQIDYKRTINKPNLTSSHIFEQKKKILTMYYLLSAEI